ncbi:unnamed protein product [Phaedon cochleariae]|uniref:Cytochrome P450 n=1 Tax=Phaedon cochleariae TaxID=80249 RepID=A0A9N9X150_PHACE|nr:unnamed protein product [Phaedon cochleariae]
MFLLLSTVSAILAIWYLKFLWGRRKMYIHSWNTPGPFAFPLVGCSYLFLSDLQGANRRVIELLRLYPGLMRLWLGPYLIYIPTKPEYVQKLLNNVLEKQETIRYNDYPGRTGLIAASVKVWKRHRKMIMPTFSQKILNSFMDKFNEKAQILCKQMDEHVGQKNVDFYDMISKCTLDIICETAMGIGMNTQTIPSDYDSSMNRLIELICLRAMNVRYHIEFIWKLSSAGKSWKKPYEICRNFTSNVIKKKIEEHTCNSKETVVETRRTEPFLDYLVKTESFTEQELCDEVNTVLAAGTETSARTVLSMMMALGVYQDIQEKVYEEVMEVLGPDRQVEPQDISRMKYTDRAVKETLRIFPTAPVTVRTVETDLRLDEKYLIPEGSIIFILLTALHRDPNYWPDPFKFDPDRFLPENIAKRHAGSYLPFMSGPRNCIGGGFAIMSIITIIAHLTRKYRFFTEYKTLEEIEVLPLLSLKLVNGSKLWIERR